jgi:hypothetical protein
MDLRTAFDAELEAYLRQRAYDDFQAELVVDQLPNGEWRARCMQYSHTMGDANMFSAEGAESRRGILEALYQAFDLKDEMGPPPRVSGGRLSRGASREGMR